MELGEWFLAGLRAYDDGLSAVYDDHEDTIHIIYSKSGKKSLAYSVKREFGEFYNEMQRKILKELPARDVARRFGSGEAYDDYLYEQEQKHRATAQKKIDDDRLAKMKEYKWQWRAALENARRGIFNGKGKPMEIPSVSMHIPKEGEGAKK